jgi:hypothetical protein
MATMSNLILVLKQLEGWRVAFVPLSGECKLPSPRSGYPIQKVRYLPPSERQKIDSHIILQRSGEDDKGLPYGVTLNSRGVTAAHTGDGVLVESPVRRLFIRKVRRVDAGDAGAEEELNHVALVIENGIGINGIRIEVYESRAQASATYRGHVRELVQKKHPELDVDDLYWDDVASIHNEIIKNDPYGVEGYALRAVPIQR